MKMRTKNTLEEREKIERATRLMTGGYSYDDLIRNDTGNFHAIAQIEDPESDRFEKAAADDDDEVVITPRSRLLRG